jgi:hypothetical protein
MERGGWRLVGVGMVVAWLTIGVTGRAQAQVTQFAAVPVRDGTVALIDTARTKRLGPSSSRRSRSSSNARCIRMPTA